MKISSESTFNSKKIIIFFSVLNSTLILINIKNTRELATRVEAINFFLIQVKNMSTFFSTLSGIISGLYQQYLLSIVNTLISFALSIDVYINFEYSSTVGFSLLIPSYAILLFYLAASLFISYKEMTKTILLYSGPDIQLNRRCVF